MPKRRIIHSAGHAHFVTFSTYQRRRFLDSAKTRDIVLVVLQKCLLAHNVNCAGFVIMPNHVHVIVWGNEDFDVSSFIQVWKKTSSYRIKKFFEREMRQYAELCPEGSPIWQAGFFDFNIDTDHKLNEKIEYMHNNPVKAGLAESVLAWNWSSAKFYEQGETVGVTLTSRV